MRRTLCAALCALSLTSWAAGLDFDQGVDVRQTVQTLQAGARETANPQASPAKVPEAEWTVMYFINAKNNLAPYVDPDLNHMEEVGSTDKMKVVVELGRPNTSTKRYLMQKDDSTGTLTSPVVVDIGQVDMGDWRHLADYGRWAKANYPAKKYLLSIWNHGSGWIQGKPAEEQQNTDKGISYDDETGNHISTTELAQALSAMGGVDIIAMDACLMQMAEVGYELRQHAGLVIASQDIEPAVGWNYALYLGPLSQNPTMGPQQLGQAYVEAFRQSYSGSRNTTQSVIDPGTFREFVPVLDAWTGAVMGADEKNVVKDARARVQSFRYADNIDLIHFAALIDQGTRSESVRSAGTALISFLRERMVLSNTSTGSGLGNASGLAVYLPTGPVSGEYSQLAWARDTGWPRFAAWVSSLHETRVTSAKR